MLKLLWFICVSLTVTVANVTSLLKIITWLHSLLWFQRKSATLLEQQLLIRLSFIMYTPTTTRPNFFSLPPKGVIYINPAVPIDSTHFFGNRLNSYAPWSLQRRKGQGGVPFNQYRGHSPCSNAYLYPT